MFQAQIPAYRRSTIDGDIPSGRKVVGGVSMSTIWQRLKGPRCKGEHIWKQY